MLRKMFGACLLAAILTFWAASAALADMVVPTPTGPTPTSSTTPVTATTWTGN